MKNVLKAILTDHDYCKRINGVSFKVKTTEESKRLIDWTIILKEEKRGIAVNNILVKDYVITL